MQPHHMKKKFREACATVAKVVSILLLIISLILAHEIASFLSRVIPIPLVIGGLFGFGFGWLVYEKKVI
jgi:hypothetical protein